MAKKKPEPAAAPKLTRVRLEVDDDEHRRLRIAAAEENVSLTVLARRIVNEWLERRGKA